MTGHRIIKVAADGSPGSRRAYVWALSEAGRRGSAVELVTAFTGVSETGESIDLADAEAAAEGLTQATMRGIDGPVGIPVSYRVVQGEPADVLVRETRASELLVMGSHGVQALRHSALGSVADMCARMAECPVVIVPVHRKHAVDELIAAGATDAASAEPVARSDAE
jgi:nucleotide-binding universal stress UspA family protein